MSSESLVVISLEIVIEVVSEVVVEVVSVVVVVVVDANSCPSRKFKRNNYYFSY